MDDQYGLHGRFHAIRIRISLQYGEKGSVNYLLTPDCGDRWEQVVPRDCRTTMRQLFESPASAYQMGNFGQLGGLVYTHIIPNPVDFRGGFIQTTLYVDRRCQLPASKIIEALGKTERLLLANQDRFHASIKGMDYAYTQQVQAAADAMLQELTKYLQPAYSPNVPKQVAAISLNYYRVATNRQQLEEVFGCPEQSVFAKTPLLTIIESAPNPASSVGHSFVPYDRTGKCVEETAPCHLSVPSLPQPLMKEGSMGEEKSFFRKYWALMVAFGFGMLFAYLIYCCACVMNNHNPWPFSSSPAATEETDTEDESQLPLTPPEEGEKEWGDELDGDTIKGDSLGLSQPLQKEASPQPLQKETSSQPSPEGKRGDKSKEIVHPSRKSDLKKSNPSRGIHPVKSNLKKSVF